MRFDCAGSHKPGVEETSRHFGPLRSFSLWRGANSALAGATLLSLWSCQIALAVAWCNKKLLEISWRDRSCQEVSYRDLTNRALIQTSQRSFRDLAKRPLIGSLYPEIFKGSCQETSYREFVQRSCQEISCRDLAKRARIESLRGDLSNRSCQETSSLREVAPRAVWRCVAKGSLTGVLPRELL